MLKPKNFIFIVFIGLALLWLAPSSAQALTFHLDSFGGLKLYQGEVMGRDNAAAGNKELPSQAKESRRTIIKDYGSNGRKQVKIQPGTQNNIEAQVRTQNHKETEQIGSEEQTQTYESNQVRLILDEQAEVKPKLKDENSLENLETKAQEKEEGGEKRESETQELIIERSQDNQFTFRSGEVRARTGAQFILDQTTGLVTIVTPSGETHQLKHFPESAMSTMLEESKMTFSENDKEPTDITDEKLDNELENLVDEESDAAETAQPIVKEEDAITPAQDYDLELTENEDGEVVYKLTGDVEKKLFGLIPWSLTQELEMVDSTGEVKVKRPSSIFNRVLKVLSTS